MSSQTLTDYFNTIISGAQQFIDQLPDEFLHNANKNAFQLISEIRVYLRSWQLTKKEYGMITHKTEQLIEEVEKLEIAYESWSSDSDVSQFGEDFKSEFDQVLEKSSTHELWNTYMSWQEIWTKKISLVFSRIEVPLLLWIIVSSILFFNAWATSLSMFVVLLISLFGLCLLIVKSLIRLWRVPFVLILLVWSVTVSLI